MPLDAGMTGFVDRNLESGNLYSSIDEGVIIGDDYHEHLGLGVVSDDSGSWITPNTFRTESTFQYKSELTNFHIGGQMKLGLDLERPLQWPTMNLR